MSKVDFNPDEPLLTVSKLNAWYGAAHILFDVDLNVRRGEVVALMGRNGAGKSTTLKSIMGLMEKSKGDIHFMGSKVSGRQSFEIARRGVGFVPEDRRVFSDLTVTENLEVGRQPSRTWPDGTLMGNPFLVLLDEPSEGVAPLIVEQMANMIIALKEHGVSVLLSEQNVHFPELVSDRVYVLEKGQIRYAATMAELAENEEIRRSYLTV